MSHQTSLIDSRIYVASDDFMGCVGLVFVGKKIIVYMRTADAPTFPLKLALPGGGSEAGESPIETFVREVREEFGLDLVKEDVKYARQYPDDSGLWAYYFVAKLGQEEEAKIKFGDEGIWYKLMDLEEYLSYDEAWPPGQQRARDYLAAV